MKERILLALSWLLLLLAVPLGMIAAIVGFLGAASFISSPFWICAVALFVGLLVSGCLAQIAAKRAAKRVNPKNRNRLAWAIGSGTVVLMVLISALTLFKPLAPALKKSALSMPDDVKFWDLETGSRIAYLKVSAREKVLPEPIVFIHGGPGAGIISARFVVDTIAVFAARGYDVYLYDQIGGGYSGRLSDVKDYSLSRQVRDLEGIRRKIGADKLILIGESFGACLGVHYLARYPARVAKCVFVSPGEWNQAEWRGKNRGAPKDRLDKAAKAEFARRMQAHLPRLLLAELLADVNPAAAPRFISDREGDAFICDLFSLLLPAFSCDPKKLAGASVDFGFWASFMMERDLKKGSRDIRPQLAAIRIPALILKGECDYVHPDVAAQYNSALPGSRLLFIRGAGHMIYVDRRDVFIAAVNAFLAGEQLP